MNRKIIKIISVILIVVAIGCITENMLPKDIEDDSFYYINPVENTEYISGVNKLGKKSVCTYAFLNGESSDDGKDEFTITIAKIEGIFKNRYNIYVFMPQDDNELLNPSYDSIVQSPQYEIKSGNKYYGSVYTGIVPSNCKKLTFDGTQADLKTYSINLNGEKAEFVFYSCFVEQGSYPDTVNIEYERI